MIPVNFLSKIGFQFSENQEIAKLQIDKQTFIHLRRGTEWALGHSTDGEKVYYRPGGNSPYQFVRNTDELLLEIL